MGVKYTLHNSIKKKTYHVVKGYAQPQDIDINYEDNMAYLVKMKTM